MKKSLVAWLVAGFLVFGLFTSCKGIHDIYDGGSLVIKLPGAKNNSRSAISYITHYRVLVENGRDNIEYVNKIVAAGDTITIRGLEYGIYVIAKVMPLCKKESVTKKTFLDDNDFLELSSNFISSNAVMIQEDAPAVADIFISDQDMKSMDKVYYTIEGDNTPGNANHPAETFAELKKAIESVSSKKIPTRIYVGNLYENRVTIVNDPREPGITVRGNVELVNTYTNPSGDNYVRFEREQNNIMFYVNSGATFKVASNRFRFISTYLDNITNPLTTDNSCIYVNGGTVILNQVQVYKSPRTVFINARKYKDKKNPSEANVTLSGVTIDVSNIYKEEVRPCINLYDRSTLNIDSTIITNSKNTPAILAEQSANITAYGLVFNSCSTGKTTSANISGTGFENNTTGIIKINQTTEFNFDKGADYYSLPGHFEFNSIEFNDCEGEEILSGTDIYLGGKNTINKIYMYDKLYDEGGIDGYCSYPRIYLKSNYVANSDITPTIVVFPTYYLSEQSLYKLTSGFYTGRRTIPAEMIIQEEDDGRYKITDCFVNYTGDGCEANQNITLCDNGIFCKNFVPTSFDVNYRADHQNFILRRPGSVSTGFSSTITSRSTIKINRALPVNFYGSRLESAELNYSGQFPAFEISTRNVNADYDVVFDGSYGPIVINAAGTTSNYETVFDLKRLDNDDDGSFQVKKSRALFKDVTINAASCTGVRLSDEENYACFDNCKITVTDGGVSDFPVLVNGNNCTVELKGSNVPDVYINGDNCTVNWTVTGTEKIPVVTLNSPGAYLNVSSAVTSPSRYMRIVLSYEAYFDEVYKNGTVVGKFSMNASTIPVYSEDGDIIANIDTETGKLILI